MKPFANEKEFQQAVVDLCTVFGLLCYHTWRPVHSAPGFPDCVIVGRRVVYVELKMENGRVSLDQRKWMDRLTAAGEQCYLWRPQQWTDGTIQSVLLAVAGGVRSQQRATAR
jgi:hypothetical protein